MSHQHLAAAVALAVVSVIPALSGGPGSSAAGDHSYHVSGAASSAAADRYLQDSREAAAFAVEARLHIGPAGR